MAEAVTVVFDGTVQATIGLQQGEIAWTVPTNIDLTDSTARSLFFENEVGVVQVGIACSAVGSETLGILTGTSDALFFDSVGYWRASAWVTNTEGIYFTDPLFVVEVRPTI